MSKYHITHSCGHTITHDLVGAYADRDRKEAWLKTTPCMECRRAAERAEAASQTADLPALTGTDKQIAWATTIRAKAVADLRPLRERAAAAAERGNDNGKRALVVLDAILANTEARYWIDQRGTDYSDNWLGQQIAK